MNKFNFVRDGESKLPPGFRFQPTDEEIVFQYLARKIFSYPLPASVIPEINMIFSFGPWDLPGNLEQDRYFFANREVNHHGSIHVNRIMRGNCVGFWKCRGLDKQIIRSKRMPIVGMKKTFVFYKGKQPCATPTHWFMHVYCVALSGNTPTNYIHHKRHSQGSFIQIGKWVLCHVFLKRSMINDEVYGRQQINYDGFMTAESSDTASSSSSSSSSSSDSDSSVLSEVSSAAAHTETN